MGQLHALGAAAVLAGTLAVGLALVAVALRGGSTWSERLRFGLQGLIGLQLIAGVLLWLSGSGPREGLHLLYAVVAAAVLPLASTFASDAPPRPRAWVMASACGVLLAILWRLAATG